MQPQTDHKRTIEEKLICWALLFTYPVYAVGGLYITGPALGWTVLAIVMLRCFIEGNNHFRRVPMIIWLWGIGMLVMLLSLWVAHADWSLGLAKTIKSTVGWAKGWALLGIFPLLGAMINLRPEQLIRAVCVVGKHTAIFGMITFLLYLIGAPGLLYISPLQILGGAGDNFFMVSLYGLNPETNAGRWQFFAPWAPAAGFISCIFVIFCLQEQDKAWRNWGIAGCAVMVLMSQSRAGWAIFICIVPLFLLTRQLKKPWVLLGLGFLLPLILLLGEPVYEWVMESFQQIKEARPASTRVRTTLENLAVQRWRAEAPVWGHGIVESGPKLVEFMPIGSHHTWYGLLFVKGLVGLFALAIPVAFSLIYLLLFSAHNVQARAAMCMLSVFTCYSFYENVEILAYLLWPALLWLGMTFKSLQSGELYV